MRFFGWLSLKQKEDLIEWFITYQQYVSTGKSLFSTITEPAKYFFGFLGIATAVVAPEFILENTLVLGVGVFAFFIFIPYYLGWWWDKRAYFRKQTVWNNRRNDMKEQLDRMESQLDAVLKRTSESQK